MLKGVVASVIVVEKLMVEAEAVQAKPTTLAIVISTLFMLIFILKPPSYICPTSETLGSYLMLRWNTTVLF